LTITPPFQQQLKVACGFLPPVAAACLKIFEQLIFQQVAQLQDFISKQLHLYTFSSILGDA
jgi:hypothetical protein